MKIGIDYRFAVTTVRGIGRNIRELTDELMRIDTVNEYILYVQHDPGLTLPENFKVHVLPKGNIILYEQVYLPLRARKDRVGALWYPSNSGPLFLHRSIKLLVTVNDLIVFKRFTQLNLLSFSQVKYRMGEYYRRYALLLGLKRIDSLLTISEYSAQEIRQLLKRDATVIYIHIRQDAPSFNDAILARLGLISSPYLYSMTGDAPQKNLDGLLRIMDAGGLDHKLVISGVHQPGLIAKMSDRYKGQVIFTGRISEEEKNSLYKNAAAFIFIPFYEGFGIPVLEAMYFHLPLIISNRASVPEVLGKGGELTDPEDTGRVRALVKALPWDMTKYIPAQQSQLKKFSDWNGAARKLLQLIEH